MLHQDGMRALFNDGAMVHDQDQIGIPDGRQTVGDDERGLVAHQFFHGFLDQDFSTGIDRGRCFIQDQDGRIRQEGSGDRQQLFLARRDVVGFFVDQ